jgi:hypothetical protein
MKNACIKTAERRRFWRDETGAAFLEFTVTLPVFFLLLFGTVEMGLLFFQWNVATKAVQLGARLAAVSDPVSSDLLNMTGLNQTGRLPGDQMPDFDRICDGASATCTSGTYDAAAMSTLVYGRGDNACNSTGSDLGMCDIYGEIRPENVVVRYQYTGLGYAGRPGGPVPTITVSLQNIDFDFIALDGLLGFRPIPIPGLRTTITGEDLRGNGS